MRVVRIAPAALLWIAGSLGIGPARADVQVNTYTTSSQYSASVGLDSEGDFVVVWASFGSGGTDSDGFSIQGQRYSSDGSQVAAQFQVNTYSTSDQRSPSVGLDSDGDFVVVWTSNGSGGTDSDSYSVQGQRYASDGTELGAQFQVNTYTTNRQEDPSVTLDSDGDFVVVWSSVGSGGTDSDTYSIQGQRYSSDGSAAGAQFQVNTYTTDEQTSPSVAVDSDGDFVVVWRSAASSGTDTSADSVQGQRYASDGSAAGVQFQVNTYTTSVQTSPAVSMDSAGDFVVVWQSSGSGGTDSDGYSVQHQRFASDGSALGAQVQVNTYVTSLQFDAVVGMDSTGDFIVVWNSSGSSGTDTSGPSIQGRRYNSDGSAMGPEFQINTYTTGFQDTPSVGMDSDGDFVVVWTSSGSDGTDTSSYSIQKTDPGLVPVELQSFAIE